MLRRLGIVIAFLFFGLWGTRVVLAHATLIRSEPAANSELSKPPAEIRLWFSESVEPQFSGFTLLDSGGNTVSTPASQPDPADNTLLIMRPNPLPDGLYTVIWHTVSAADGHSMQGSFAFSIGMSLGASGTKTIASESIPPDGTLIRWLNFLSMSLAVGSLGFILFVWTPAITDKFPQAERRMSRLIWAGWVALGAAGLLMLLLQVSLAGQIPITKAIGSPVLIQVVSGTRYGLLWMARMGLWLVLGFLLFLAMTRHRRAYYWLALLAGIAILLTNSLFSHASASQDAFAAVISDWLHLSLTALWLGGLAQFIVVLGLVRRSATLELAALDKLVGYFSNFARVLVAGLLLTGLYAAWLEVGSPDGLLTTLYGQVLVIKLVLVLGLIGIAGINLIFTHRGLKAGQTIWAGRLRGLIIAEIVIATSVLVTVGAMTSLSPSRTVLEQRVLAAAVPPTNPIIETKTADNLHLQLLITPGWVGNNTFVLMLTDPGGKPISNASLIRLRFDDQSADLGTSELRIEPPAGATNNGAYSVAGANLSQAGDWRLRITIQRPGQYDSVVDFKPTVTTPTLPALETPQSIPGRIPILFLAGVIALGIGSYFLSRSRLSDGPGLASVGLVLLGIVFVGSGIGSLAANRASKADSAVQNPVLHIELENPPQQAPLGKNTLVVVVHDTQNNPVNDAKIEVVGNMTDPGMIPSFGTVSGGQAGRYSIPFDWTMAGEWILTVNVTLPDGRQSQQTFRINAKEP